MKTVELKKKLIKKINTLENQMLLEEICRVVGIPIEDDDIYYLSEEQLKAVEEAERQYENGQFLTNEEADKEIKEWLGE